jgi:hypothetical protein
MMRLSKKQLGVIYAAFKKGLLEDVDSDDMKAMYDFYRIHYDNYESMRKSEILSTFYSFKEAVDDIFNNDYHHAALLMAGAKNLF